ncbi:NADH dehydrogenase [ubiquinone] 1 alpha subcomplex subunit 13 [Patella vulgata]|uniref:NADH dehydrogenase [ubiquinone] 1 alpha subcomplex subunit 13 n=1 Tax=Patella vulgata TaxID=6465 RepID=UPI0021807DD2|nr:NADH dehydrogenase [ubiquinone] 1 alpha subcomplex subunit 13 [Patella vulgata]
MASRTFKQEMPPKGGFGPIEWTKGVPKPKWSGYKQFSVFTGFTLASWAIWYRGELVRRREMLEMREARIAVYPLIEAERHRLYLMHCRKNRDEENELMKNHPGWITGTLYGKRPYHNVRGRFIDQSCESFYAHNKPKDMIESTDSKFYHDLWK